MFLFYLDYLFLFRNIRYYLGAYASQVLFKLLKSKGGNFGQKWPKSWKQHAVQNEFRRERKTQSINWFDFRIHHEIQHYLSAGFFNTINRSCLIVTLQYVQNSLKITFFYVLVAHFFLKRYKWQDCSTAVTCLSYNIKLRPIPGV